MVVDSEDGMSDTDTSRVARAGMAVVVVLSLFTVFGGVAAAGGQAEDPTKDPFVTDVIKCADVEAGGDGTVVVRYGQAVIVVDATEGDVSFIPGSCAVTKG
jgi:hypothetical protein